MSDEENVLHRLVVFGGDGAAGKTSLFLHRMGRLPAVYIPTKVDYLRNAYLINGKTVEVNFSDYEGGGEDWWALRHLGYGSADCVVLCFEIYRDNLDYIKDYWYPFTKKYCPKAKRILVGTKKDERDNKELIERLANHGERLATYEEGEELSKEIKAECYLECSTVTGEGVEDVFNKAAEVASTVYIDHDVRRKCCII